MLWITSSGPLQFLYFFAVVILSYFVKGITGFGNTLVMSPLFSFAAPNKLITPVDLLLGFPTNAYMAFRERKHISPRIVLPLTVMLAAGIIPGVFLLKAGSDWVLKSVLGAAVVAMAVEMALRKPVAAAGGKSNPILLTLIGVVSGVLCGMFGIGALLVAYISRTTDSMGAFRANLCSVFLIENLFRIAIYSLTGILTAQALLLSLLLLPAAVIGLFIGIRVSARLKPETAKKAVLGLLVVSGSVLFVTNFFFH